MSGDKYKSFNDLARSLRRDSDYRVTALDRASPLSVLAIHGGRIEPGTAEIAHRIAGSDANLYIFEALVSPGFDQHVTSVHFDDPDALAVVARGKLAISVHGFKGDGSAQVCITGPHASLNAIAFRHLQGTGLLEQDTTNPSGKFLALDDTNIVNRGPGHGVQLEISRALRDTLLADSGKLSLFADGVRRAATEWLASPAPGRNIAPGS